MKDKNEMNENWDNNFNENNMEVILNHIIYNQYKNIYIKYNCYIRF